MILNWVGKEEAIILANSDTDKVLLENSADSVNWNNTNNLFIEGDNIEVLKILKKDYSNKVNVIYIDPPYNTGNKFIYNDKFKHDNWLSMIYPRLILAKELLSDNGVIFISIDDNEQAQLKLLCDEVFGEDNFVANCPRKTRTSAKTQSSAELQCLHDYLLIYFKNKSISSFNLIKTGEREFKYTDERGRYDLAPLQYSGMHEFREDRPNLYYPIYIHNGKCFLEKQSEEDTIVLPKQKKGKDTCWAWSKKRFTEKNNLLLVKENNIYIKNYYDSNKDNNIYQKYKSFLDDNKFMNTNGTKDVNKLIDNCSFQHPKPVELIKWCLQLASKPDSIVLDFFAGSGTTAQAVMELNKEDNGNRKFILVQLPENNIQEITKERIRRAGKVIKQELNNVDIGFKCYKI